MDAMGYGPRGDLFPKEGFGHTGYTGTSVWADKASKTIVIILANRVHPEDKGDISLLRRRVANVVAAEIYKEKFLTAGKNLAARLVLARRGKLPLAKNRGGAR
jgi:CubicO group peptidase (beta-lactamase class C family)